MNKKEMSKYNFFGSNKIVILRDRVDTPIDATPIAVTPIVVTPIGRNTDSKMELQQTKGLPW